MTKKFRLLLCQPTSFIITHCKLGFRSLVNYSMAWLVNIICIFIKCEPHVNEYPYYKHVTELHPNNFVIHLMEYTWTVESTIRLDPWCQKPYNLLNIKKLWGQFLPRLSVCICNHFWLRESHIGRKAFLFMPYKGWPMVIEYH